MSQRPPTSAQWALLWRDSDRRVPRNWHSGHEQHRANESSTINDLGANQIGWAVVLQLQAVFDFDVSR